MGRESEERKRLVPKTPQQSKFGRGRGLDPSVRHSPHSARRINVQKIPSLTVKPGERGEKIKHQERRRRRRRRRRERNTFLPERENNSSAFPSDGETKGRRGEERAAGGLPKRRRRKIWRKKGNGPSSEGRNKKKNGLYCQREDKQKTQKKKKDQELDLHARHLPLASYAGRYSSHFFAKFLGNQIHSRNA